MPTPVSGARFPSLYYQFLANVVHLGHQDKVVPFPNTTANASRFFKAMGGPQPDLVYIDAGHYFEDVVADLATGGPWCAPAARSSAMTSARAFLAWNRRCKASATKCDSRPFRSKVKSGSSESLLSEERRDELRVPVHHGSNMPCAAVNELNTFGENHGKPPPQLFPDGGRFDPREVDLPERTIHRRRPRP